MGKTLKEILKRLPARRRAKVKARSDELLAEQMSLKGSCALIRSTRCHRSVGRSGLS
jgi:hypothetical protein